MQILSTFLLVSALAAGLADASPTKTVRHGLVRRGGSSDNKSPSKTTMDSCSSEEFFWEVRSCCLPSGGPSATPTPPSGVGCPSSWYFHHGQGCCVPRASPTHSATPTCSGSEWSWLPSLQCCTKGGSTPSSTPTPAPSAKPKSGSSGKDKDKKDVKGGQNEKGWKIKRNFEQWDASFCPTGLTTCPIISNGVLTGDSECIDTLSDLTSCGGCTSLGKGADCSTISGASCYGGVCVVDA